MPHKVNPVTAERISGLARYIRGHVVSALENIVLWHERDLTNSSFERITIPHVILAIDEILELTLKLISRLVINEEAITKNLKLSRGAIMSERVMLELIRRGMSRTEAYGIIREATLKAYIENKNLLDVLASDSRVLKLISREELKKLLDPKTYLGSYDKLIDRCLKYVLEVLDVKMEDLNSQS